MVKTKGIMTFLDDLAQKNYGRTLTDALKGNVCVMCGEPADEFKDALSKKEYSISGMCQTCQDEVFGG